MRALCPFKLVEDPLNKLLPTLLVSTLLISACGSEQALEKGSEPSVGTATSSSASSSPSTSEAPDSSEESCRALMLGERAPIYDIVRTMQVVIREEVISDEWPDQARVATDEAERIAATAGSDMRRSIEEMIMPLNTILDSKTFSPVNEKEFDEDVQRILTSCESEDIRPVSSRVWTPEDVATAKPSGTTTFESEFLAAGISTGYGNPSIEEYIKLPVQNLCNPDITDTSPNFRQLVRIWTGGGFPENEAKLLGKGETFTRLIVKYHCPDRLDGLTAIIGAAD